MAIDRPWAVGIALKGPQSGRRWLPPTQQSVRGDCAGFTPIRQGQVSESRAARGRRSAGKWVAPGRLAALAASLLALPALGQLGSGVFAIELSADGGETWRSGLTEVEPGPRTVLWRLSVEWTADAGYYFAGSQFDLGVFGPEGATDTVTNAVRPYFFQRSTTQVIVVTRFGSMLKIDDSRDTLPFGEGPRGVFPAQLPEAFAQWPPPTRDNPAHVFTFDLNLDGTPGDRYLSATFVPASNGALVRIYTTYTGAQNSLGLGPNHGPLEIRFASVRVIPAPASLALAVVALAWGRRRR